MIAFIPTAIVGMICIIIGISNRRGNISSLHSYHRARVAPEDVLPFGKAVGLGMIIIGASIILFSIIGTLAILLKRELYTTIGMVLMFIGMAVGFTITFRALKKYNKGIF